jgi:energy-coupling factor transport system permease protein
VALYFDSLFSSESSSASQWFARVDPRVRVAGLLIFVILVSVILNPKAFAVISAAALILLVSARIGKRVLLRSTPAALLTMLITMILHLAFSNTPGGSQIRVIGLTISTNALVVGALYCWRVLLFFMLAICWVKLISPDDFAIASWKLLSPLRRIKLPVSDIGMALLIAIRFIPAMAQQFHQIEFAQKARGLRIEGSWIRRIRTSTALIVPTVASAIRRSDVLGDALIVRGWGLVEKRTFLNDRPISTLEIVALVIILMIATAVIVVAQS